MRNLLATPHREVLEQFALSNVLLAFDYDGTLAPIVADPQRAAMRRRTRDLLAETARLYPVIVLSGRGRRDIATRLAGVGVDAALGDHGAPPGSRPPATAAEVRRWLSLLRSRLAAVRGVVLEDKTFSVALHYRRSRSKKAARTAILAAVAELPPARLVAGHQVFNVVPLDAPHKGVALERERARLGCDTALYVGDDESDEDVFALDQPGRLLAVRVGRKPSSAASYYLRDQPAVDLLLRHLVRARSSARARREA